MDIEKLITDPRKLGLSSEDDISYEYEFSYDSLFENSKMEFNP